MKKSRILEAVHETAQGLYEAGVMDQVTMREFDIMCLPKVEKLEPQKGTIATFEPKLTSQVTSSNYEDF